MKGQHLVGFKNDPEAERTLPLILKFIIEALDIVQDGLCLLTPLIWVVALTRRILWNVGDCHGGELGEKVRQRRAEVAVARDVD